MIFNFLNGNSQQRQWFKETCDLAWAAWYDNFSAGFPRLSGITQMAVRCDVLWTDSPSGGDAEGSLSYAYDTLGMSAHMELANGLTDPASSMFQGEAFYKECVMHQLAHMTIARQIEPYPSRKQAICTLVGKPLSSWSSGPWADQVREGAAELFKDGLAAPGYRVYENRTNIRLNLSGATAVPPGSDGTSRPVEWINFCGQFRTDQAITRDYPFSDTSPVYPFTLEWVGIVSNPFSPSPEGTYRGEVLLPFVNSFASYVLHLPDLPASDGWWIRFTRRMIALYDAQGLPLSGSLPTNVWKGTTGFPTRIGSNPATGLARFSNISASTQGSGGQGPIGLYDWSRLPIRMVCEISAPQITSQVPLSVSAEASLNPISPGYTIDPPPPWPPKKKVGRMMVD